MNKHPETKVIIRGYASPEGSVEVNARIAARAEAVKTILVKKYRIAATRYAEGLAGGRYVSPNGLESCKYLYYWRITGNESFVLDEIYY